MFRWNMCTQISFNMNTASDRTEKSILKRHENEINVALFIDGCWGKQLTTSPKKYQVAESHVRYCDKAENAWSFY